MICIAYRDIGLGGVKVETPTHTWPCSVLSTGPQHNLSEWSCLLSHCAWDSETPWCDELSFQTKSSGGTSKIVVFYLNWTYPSSYMLFHFCMLWLDFHLQSCFQETKYNLMSGVAIWHCTSSSSSRDGNKPPTIAWIIEIALWHTMCHLTSGNQFLDYQIIIISAKPILFSGAVLHPFRLFYYCIKRSQLSRWNILLRLGHCWLWHCYVTSTTHLEGMIH